MKYFVISTVEGATQAESHYNSKDLGSFVDGISSYESNGETFSGIYYLEGIREFDNFLNGLGMHEQFALLDMLYYANFQLLICLKNKKSSVIISIPDTEIENIIVYPDSSGYERGPLAISGTGLIGLVGREISKKYLKTKPIMVNGVKFTLFFADESKMTFFTPNLIALNVLPFLQKHFEEKIKVYN